MPNPVRFTQGATLDAAKTTSLKSAAATLVTDMATAVSGNDFVTARKKAAQLEDLYGKLSQARPPSST